MPTPPRGLVMVVDDDEDIRESLTLMLTLKGYAVVSAADGQEALRLLREAAHEPCVILLDLMMPGMNGFQFREALTADPILRAVPVVAITGAGPAYHRRSAELEIELLPKPFDFGVLLDVVRRFCPPPAAPAVG
jgi:CheY-like chemotaxis protein